MSYGEIFNTDEPEPWESAEDEEEMVWCAFCGEVFEDDSPVFYCGHCAAPICGSDCAEGHNEEEHGK